MTKEWEPENVFDLLGDELARKILAVASVESLSAQEIAEACDSALPTVYRRINALVEHDMLTEKDEVDPDGNHYKTFETNLKRICFEIEEGSFDIDMKLRKDMVDRFGEMWNDLERKRGEEE